MVHKFDPAHKHRLTDAERRKILDPTAVLGSLPITPGQSVADIGCGVGYFTVPLAQRVRPGSVYAVDILAEMVEATRGAATEASLDNVRVAQSQESSIPLPDSAVDGVFVAFVLHEAEHRAAFLAELARILRPGGWLAIVEWQKKETPVGPPQEVRLSPEEMRRDVTAAGFQAGHLATLNELHYLHVFVRGAVS